MVVVSLMVISGAVHIAVCGHGLRVDVVGTINTASTFMEVPFIIRNVVVNLMSTIVSRILLCFYCHITARAVVGALGAGSVMGCDSVTLVLFTVFIKVNIFTNIVKDTVVVKGCLGHRNDRFTTV